MSRGHQVGEGGVGQAPVPWREGLRPELVPAGLVGGVGFEVGAQAGAVVLGCDFGGHGGGCRDQFTGRAGEVFEELLEAGEGHGIGMRGEVG